MPGEATELLVAVIEDHIAVLSLNRPAARNAINVSLARAIGAAVARVEADAAIRVAILASANPGMFCAGADLREVAAGRAALLLTAEGGFAGFTDAARRKPWIAAVGGPALGGGAELVLACDMVVATEEARFGLPEVKHGLLAGAGGVHRLARALPRNIALELAATGGTLSAAAARQYGLVNAIAPAGALLETALALARTIAANAPLAVLESLALARAAAETTDRAMRAASRQALDRLLASDDAKEGPQAFVEKRAPVWRGR